MRFFRRAFVVPIALIALALMSSPASALTQTQLSIGHTQLGLYGLSVSVRIKFTCDPSLNVAFADVRVSEAIGHRLAQGSGSFSNNFPGNPCRGTLQTRAVRVEAFGAWIFEAGKKAVASADLTLFNPVSGALTTTSVIGQAVTIEG